MDKLLFNNVHFNNVREKKTKKGEKQKKAEKQISSV